MKLHRSAIGAALLTLAGILCAQSAAAADPLALDPSGPWNANYSDDSCSLERSFANGDEAVTLRLRQYAPDEPFEVTVASDTFSLRDKKPRYRFEPADLDQEATFYETVRDSRLRAVMFSGSLYDQQIRSTPAAVRSARDKEIEGLAVEDGFVRDVFLRTGPLDGPMKAMSACLDDLLATWGLDAAAHRPLSRPVSEKEDQVWPGWLEGDFRSAVIDWPSSRIEFLLLVDEGGHITDCRVVNAPRDNELAIRVCDAAPRDWQFEPALDANQQPIKSYHRATITRVARADYRS